MPSLGGSGEYGGDDPTGGAGGGGGGGGSGENSQAQREQRAREAEQAAKMERARRAAALAGHTKGSAGYERGMGTLSESDRGETAQKAFSQQQQYYRDMLADIAGAYGETGIGPAMEGAPEEPYDFESPLGLGKFAWSMRNPATTGIMGMAKAFKYNKERQDWIRNDIMQKQGVDEATAQGIMDQEGLNINDLYSGAPGVDTGRDTRDDNMSSNLLARMFGEDFEQYSGIGTGGAGTGGTGGGDGLFEFTPTGNAAADAQLKIMSDQLKYYQGLDVLPRELREKALMTQGGALGLMGGEGAQQAFIDDVIKSPLYQNIMGGREAGEEAIMRHAGATGGLRSGDVSTNLAQFNTQLQNKALLDSYNQQMSGLGMMAGLPGYSGQVGGTLGQIGQTVGLGQTAAQQNAAWQQQQDINNMMGWGQLGLGLVNQAGGLGGVVDTASDILGGITDFFSDRRMKKDISKIGEVNGWNIYEWTWNSVAEKMGVKGKSIGCLADEVFAKEPENVTIRNMMMFVKYSRLNLFPQGA